MDQAMRRKKAMNLLEIFTGSSGLLIVLLALIQISPIKINPWSAIFRAIGRSVNSEVTQKLLKIDKKLNDHIIMDDKRNADGHRARILQFNNELLRNIDHTEEEFAGVIDDIDAYEKYCKEHPEYPNNKAACAIDNIKGNYKERMQKRDFL